MSTELPKSGLAFVDEQSSVRRAIAPSSERLVNSVANTLRQQIESGNYRVGDWLPTERVLGDELGVDRRVVRLAVNQLVESGLVYRRPHCRPIVGPAPLTERGPAANDAVVTDRSSSFIALLMWRGGGQLERTMSAQQRIFWGMNQALAEAGHHAVFLDLGEVGNEAENAEREAAQLRYVLDRGFGGLIFYPYAYRSNRALVEEVAAAVPLVMIDRTIESLQSDFVGIDNRASLYAAVRHLYDQGHHRIAYVTKNEPIGAVRERTQGYIDAVEELGISELVLCVPSHHHGQEWTGIEAVFQLPKDKRPTAVAVFNDYTAVYLVAKLQRLGLSVPEDIAVTGFDDIVPILPNGVGLTTVAQPYEEIGRSAVGLLLRRLSDRTSPVLSIQLPADLAIRGSSRGPAHR